MAPFKSILKLGALAIILAFFFSPNGLGEGIRGPLNSVSSAKAEIASTLDLGDPEVEQTAVTIAKDYPGEYNLNQVSEVYDALRKGWYYYSDPSYKDKYKHANRTLQDGKISNSIGVGDCDDFAILMASILESLQGSTRIVFAYDRDTGKNHAYAEVYLGKKSDPRVDKLIGWLKDQNNQNDIPGQTVSGDEVWLNLDYNSTFPGGRYVGEGHRVEREVVWQSASRNSPKIVPIIDTMDSTAGWETIIDEKESNVSIGSVPSPKGKAIQLDFNLKEERRVGIFKNVSGAVLSQVKGLNLSYYGLDRQITIQLILRYSNGTGFGYSWNPEPGKKWSGLEALFEDFTIVAHGTSSESAGQRLDPNKVEKLELIFQLDESDSSGSEKIIIDNIRGAMNIPLGSSWARAKAKENMLIASNLAEASDYLLEHSREKLSCAMLLAIESLRYCETPKGYNVLRKGLQNLASCIFQFRHDDEVNAVTFSPDGKMIATASRDNTARIWDSATGKELQRMYHDDDVNAVVFSPDCRWLATASNDNTSRIWDIKTGKEIHRLSHRYDVTKLAFSPDGRRIATASNEIHVWEVETGKELFSHDIIWGVGALAYSPDGSKLAVGSGGNASWIFNAETGEKNNAQTGEETYKLGLQYGLAGAMINPDGSKISSGPDVAFSPDGNMILLALNDGSVRIYDADLGVEIQRLDLNSQVNKIAFSPDGKMAATAGDDGNVRIWDAKSWIELHCLEHEAQVHSVVFSPDGKMIATAIWGKIARIWDVKTGKELYRLDHDGIVKAIAFSPDSKSISTAGFDKIVRLYDINKGTDMRELSQDGPVWRVIFSPDSKMIATPSWDCTAKIWDTSTGRELLRLKHDAAVQDVDFSPDCRKIATGSDDGTARIWDAATGAELHRLDHYNISQNNSLFQMQDIKFSPNGRMVATAGSDKTARIWDVETGKEIHCFIYNGTVVDLEFSPYNTQLAAASWDHTARIWDTKTGDELNRLNHEDEVWGVAFSPDGRKIATAGSWDGTVRIWDAKTGEEILRLRCNAMVKDAIFSSDGQKIAAKVWESEEDTARVWDARTGKELYRLKHDLSLNDIDFSPDGKKLATASNTIRFWDSKSGSEIQYFGQDYGVADLAFSPDGRMIASASGKNAAQLWLWRMEDLIDEACSRLDRKNLTKEEKIRYLRNVPYKEICPCEPNGAPRYEEPEPDSPLRIIGVSVS